MAEAKPQTEPAPAEPAVSQFASQLQQRETPEEATSDQPHIQAEGFSVYYGDTAAVREVTMAVPRGQITAIIGPSGCGKSTFLNAVNRMTDLIPSCSVAGDLRFDGERVYEADVVHLRRRIGMVFQKPNPFPKSVYENVAYGPKLHGRRRRAELDRIVERSLSEAGLWDEVRDRLRASATSLSGGQQQRLCIARALAVDPEVILLDEPTSALDPRATARIEDLMTELRGRYTILIVTHNMQQAARVSDYTAFLYEGELVEFGDTVSLFTNPRKKQTEDYITGRFG